MNSSHALRRLTPSLRATTTHPLPTAGSSLLAIPTTTIAAAEPRSSSTVPGTVQQLRWSSHAPMGPSSSYETRKPVTISTLRNIYKKGEPIAMLTAHDFPSAFVADAAGMDVVLVGDSLAMVALGMNDTNAVTLDDMILHCRSVTRAVRSAFVVSRLSPPPPTALFF